MKALKVLSLLPALALGLVADATARADRLWIVDNTSFADCPEIQGVVIGFLVPEQGVLLVSDRPFPGAAKIGEVRDGVLSFSVAPLGPFDLTTREASNTPISVWGTLDSVIPVGNRSGCIAFDRARFSDIDDFRTYIMWILDRYTEFAPATATGGWAMRISDRIVTLSISPDGYGSAQIRVKEGGLTELRLAEQQTIFAFLPVILDEQAGRVAVRVVDVAKGEEGKKTYIDVGIVEASYETPGVAPTEPLLEIRVLGIE